MQRQVLPINILVVDENTLTGSPFMQEHKVAFLYSSFFINLLLVLSIPTEVVSMRVVLQRVKSASVMVEGQVVSSIGPGTLALVGLHEDDTEYDLQYCAKRILGARLWPSESGGQWRHGIKQRNYDILCVSQFTLYGTLSTKKQQPDYKLAMKSQEAEQMYNAFVEVLRQQYQPDKIHDGVFGAMMEVSLVNDGPVTIMVESAPQASREENGEGSIRRYESS
jgi:D-tyrosyl-tRNA(Tyr) deacylase